MGKEEIESKNWNRWKCKACRYTDKGPVDRPVGKYVKTESEEGEVKRTLVCPCCESENWCISALQRGDFGI